jgi:ATP-binding cassette, subfamily B, bacterial
MSAKPQHKKDSFSPLRLVKYFWPHLRPHSGLIAFSFSTLLVEIGLRVLEPWPLKFIFDRVLQSNVKPRAVFGISVPSFAGVDPQTLVIFAALSLVAIASLRALVAYRSTITFANIGNSVLTEIRSQLYRHVQYLSLSFHTKAKSGDLIMRVLTDIGKLQDALITSLLPTFIKTSAVLVMLGVMLSINWKLTLVAISVAPLIFLRTVKLSKLISESAKKQRERQGLVAAAATESLTAIKTVQALSLESTFAQAFSKADEKDLKETVKSTRLSASLARSVDVIVTLSTALVLCYGARLVMRHEITAGDLLIFMAYLKYAFRPLQDMSKTSGRMAKAGAAGERIIDLLERVPDVRDLPGAVAAPAFKGTVRFEELSFAYEPGHPCLERISFEAQAGQLVAIIGPSGSGKSTLVSLILRLYDPTQGCVKIDGQDIRTFTLESLRSQISVVLQDNYIFSASVRDNIRYSVPNATEAEIEAAARLANAHEFILALPHRYDTVVAERGASLSQGQRQRIAIARAALRQAPILILDEPTTGLDKRNAQEVVEALRRLTAGRTVFFITHDLHQLASTDVVIHLEKGGIREFGRHGHLSAEAPADSPPLTRPHALAHERS